jgi:hypothetical protein
VLVAGVCLLVLLLVATRRLGAKDPPLDPDVIRRLRREAGRTMRDERFPNE